MTATGAQNLYATGSGSMDAGHHLICAYGQRYGSLFLQVGGNLSMGRMP